MQRKCNLGAVNARGCGLNGPSLSEGNSITCMLLASSVWAAIKRTAVSYFSVCVCCWHKISVSVESDLFCCLSAECCLQKNFGPNTNAFRRQREADVLHWSFMLPPCWQNSAFATYSSTSVFGLVAHYEGSWQCSKDF